MLQFLFQIAVVTHGMILMWIPITKYHNHAKSTDVSTKAVTGISRLVKFSGSKVGGKLEWIFGKVYKVY